jgi:hypothetical protein
MCAQRVTRHTSIRYSSSCHKHVNMGASIFLYIHSHRLEAKMWTTMKNNFLANKFLSCSSYLYRFRKYVSYGFPIINFCNPVVHYETPCIIRCRNMQVFHTICNDNAQHKTHYMDGQVKKNVETKRPTYALKSGCEAGPKRVWTLWRRDKSLTVQRIEPQSPGCPVCGSSLWRFW